MTLDELRDYCLSKPATAESLPFDDTTLVFKVMGKMFALISLETSPLRISLKCESEQAVELRETYPAIQPGFHLSKKHWNTITLDGSLRDSLVRQLIDHSYDRVVAGLPVVMRKELAGLS